MTLPGGDGQRPSGLGPFSSHRPPVASITREIPMTRTLTPPMVRLDTGAGVACHAGRCRRPGCALAPDHGPVFSRGQGSRRHLWRLRPGERQGYRRRRSPGRGRNANMTVREVGGCLIDLTCRDRQSDQLSAFYPGGQLRDLKFAGIGVEAPSVYETAELDRVFVRATGHARADGRSPGEGARCRGGLHARRRLALRPGDHHVFQPRRRPRRCRTARRHSRRQYVSVEPAEASAICSGPTTNTSGRPTGWLPTATRSSAPMPGVLAPLSGPRGQGRRLGWCRAQTYRLIRGVIPGCQPLRHSTGRPTAGR